MKITASVNVCLIALCAVLTGCATSRSEIKLAGPVANAPTSSVSNGPIVVIRSVKDERVFEQAPSNPSTPSLGFEGSDKASAELKARAIGRKRNGFGQALGDVTLADNQTVESVVRENLTAAFEQAGYRVKNIATDDPSVVVADVHIKKFWAWVKPGFLAITLSTDIATDISLSGAVEPVVISVHAEDGRQIVPESAWIEIVGTALTDYRAQAAQKLPAPKK
jgi:uncharacterized lipoprotein YajG